MFFAASPLVIPTLFGVTLISFLLTVLLPGNPAMVKAGPFATPEYRARRSSIRWGWTSRFRFNTSAI